MPAYKEKLKDRRWQQKRLRIFNIDNWECQKCGIENNEKLLHVHHLEYISGKMPWEYPDSLLITLCEDCHNKLHLGKFSLYEYEKNLPKLNEVKKMDNGDYYFCAHQTGKYIWMKINPIFMQKYGEGLNDKKR